VLVTCSNDRRQKTEDRRSSLPAPLSGGVGGGFLKVTGNVKGLLHPADAGLAMTLDTSRPPSWDGLGVGLSPDKQINNQKPETRNQKPETRNQEQFMFYFLIFESYV